MFGLNTIKQLMFKGRNKLAEMITPNPPPQLSIYQIFSKLLNEFPIVSIAILTKTEGVILPPSLMKKEEVVLQYGINLANPIPDLMMGSDGISATLSFGGSPFKTFIPWKAIVGISPGTPPPVGPGSGSPNLLVLKGGRYKENIGVSANDETEKISIAA